MQTNNKNGRSIFDAIDEKAPVLEQASQIHEIAKASGIKDKDMEHIFSHIHSEVDEIRKEYLEGNREKMAEEIGDMLMIGISLATEVGVDAEAAISRSLRKFKVRVRMMENILCNEGKRFQDITWEEMDKLWHEVKEALGDS